ncbi:MAG: sigma-70 family RNA polymerase sigma factor [Elusimicrobia bacterium]|nr:sigma-70 family RNA polymerase sigma factor [Elusimicrobiota bacterium]
MKFDKIVKKLTPKLRGIAYKLNGRYAVLDHDDLYQEALAHMWEEYCAGKLEGKTDSYVLQGAYYHLNNHLRGLEDNTFFARLDEQVSEDGDTLGELLPAEDDGGYEAVETQELLERCGLTEREKEVLNLYADGLTVREVGKMVGISHVSVVKTIKRIGEKAKKLIQHF